MKIKVFSTARVFKKKPFGVKQIVKLVFKLLRFKSAFKLGT